MPTKEDIVEAIVTFAVGTVGIVIALIPFAALIALVKLIVWLTQMGV